jgi:hypothetical protein
MLHLGQVLDLFRDAKDGAGGAGGNKTSGAPPPSSSAASASSSSARQQQRKSLAATVKVHTIPPLARCRIHKPRLNLHMDAWTPRDPVRQGADPSAYTGV